MTETDTETSTLWNQFLGAEVKYHDAAGIRTRVIEAGTGRPIVLLHGVSGSAETWVRNVHSLAEHGRVLAIDMVGHGFTDKPDVNYLIPTFTDHLGAFLDTLGDEPVDLIGQSLGGWVTMRYAIEHPERVRTLSNVTGAGLLVSQSKEDLEGYHDDLGQVTARALEKPTPATVRKRLEWLFHRPEDVPDELVDLRYRIFRRPDSQAILGRVMSDVIGRENQRHCVTRDELEELEVRTLVLWTLYNPTTKWPEGKAAAEALPNSRFELFEESAHWPQYEESARFNALLAEFLTEGAD